MCWVNDAVVSGYISVESYLEEKVYLLFYSVPIPLKRNIALIILTTSQYIGDIHGCLVAASSCKKCRWFLVDQRGGLIGIGYSSVILTSLAYLPSCITARPFACRSGWVSTRRFSYYGCLSVIWRVG